MHMQTRQAMLEQRDACGHTTAALTLQPVSYTHLDVYKRQTIN